MATYIWIELCHVQYCHTHRFIWNKGVEAFWHYLVFSLLPISRLGCYNGLLTRLSASALAHLGSCTYITAKRILWKITSDHVFLPFKKPQWFSCQRLSYFRVFALSVPSEWDILPKDIYPRGSFFHSLKCLLKCHLIRPLLTNLSSNSYSPNPAIFSS